MTVAAAVLWLVVGTLAALALGLAAVLAVLERGDDPAENPLLLPVGAGGVLRVLEEVTTADERERQTELLLRMRRAAAACSRCGS
ncbi:MAG: hypothetical protein BWX64_00299 [Acidobacteria bacterium ADurb.Bin051]|nr:MAG: hypothetical protein BWX64_00299 [Acidobacteria bacterium ADurb.Bin051]